MYTLTSENYKVKYLPKEYLEEAYDRKWFKIFLPKEIGGLQLSLPEGLKVLQAASRQFGSFGWILNLGGGAGYFFAFYDKETASRLFEPANAVIAGSGTAAGSAARVGNGYILNGTWPKCSGSAHATLFTVNANCNEEAFSFTLLADQVNLVDDCQLFGLKATSSQSIQVNDAFVPDNYVFKIGEVKYQSEYKLYNLPFELFARFCMGASFIGIADGFHDLVKKQSSITNPRAIVFVNELQNDLRQFEQELMNLAGRYWKKAIESNSAVQIENDEVADLIGKSCKHLFDQVCNIYYDGGLRFSNESELAHWAFRDVLTASQHFLLKPKKSDF